MAEVIAGFAGAGTTLAAVKATTSAGFTGRHESSHRTELAEMDRNLHRYRSASESGSEISFHEDDRFRGKLNTTQERLNEYYQSLNDYKDESWLHLPSKLKKRRAVRMMKRAARDENQSLRECVDNMSSEYGSDISSLYAESGSPPGSALEREQIGDWLGNLSSDDKEQSMDWAEQESEQKDDEKAERMSFSHANSGSHYTSSSAVGSAAAQGSLPESHEPNMFTMDSVTRACMDVEELNRWMHFAAKGGIGKCVALRDCVAETEEDLMFLKNDEIVVLMQLHGNSIFMGYCEGIVGRFRAHDVHFCSKLNNP